MRKYTFVTKNFGDATVEVFGETLIITIDNGLEAELDDADCYDAIAWMLRNGVEFESDRSMTYNCFHIDHMIDGESTSGLFAMVAEMSDEHIKLNADMIRSLV